jgi:hypothetical protein
MKALALPLLVFGAILCGCAEPDLDIDHPGGGGKADGFLSPVYVVDGSEYSTLLGCSGFCVKSYHIWLDIAVLDSGYDKEVGILWTADDWQSVHTTRASYEGELDESYDRWGVDVKVVDADIAPPELVQVAVFAKVGDVEHWDEQNDHYFFGPGPVTGIELDAGNFAQFPCSGGSGVCAADLRIKARVVGPQDADSVMARWTRDAWASFQDAPLSADGGDTETFDWSGNVDLRTQEEIDAHSFEPDGPVYYKLYATSHGKVVWESGDNHRLF